MTFPKEMSQGESRIENARDVYKLGHGIEFKQFLKLDMNQ